MPAGAMNLISFVPGRSMNPFSLKRPCANVESQTKTAVEVAFMTMVPSSDTDSIVTVAAGSSKFPGAVSGSMLRDSTLPSVFVP